MAVRYFERITSAGDKVALFRLNVDQVKRELNEDAWTDGAWKTTSRLMEYLFEGSTEVVEVAERDAMRDFPDALESRVAKEIHPTFIVKHLAGQHDQKTHGSGAPIDAKEIASVINEKTFDLSMGEYEEIEIEGEDREVALDSIQLMMSMGEINKGAGVAMTMYAIKDDEATDKIAIINSEGAVAGAASARVENIDVVIVPRDRGWDTPDKVGSLNDVLHMTYLGTTGIEDGVGSTLFGSMLTRAAKQNRPIVLEPLDSKARAFWHRMGFRDEITVDGVTYSGGGDTMLMSAETVAAIAGGLE